MLALGANVDPLCCHVDASHLALDHDVLAPLAATFPCAYELTAHINPQSEHAGRLGGIIATFG